jgi:peptidyl-prolyl cis-trans isomerase A (cyclophilin A)
MSKVKSSSVGQTGRILVPILITLVLLTLPVLASAKTALIKTPLGDIEIELLEADAPNTVANFLQYIESGRYEKSFIHNRLNGETFTIQGGGFTYGGPNSAPAVVTFPAVDNEFKASNIRGTIAMVKRAGQPDSATSQWFINLADNSENLDNQNGGSTVFARVIGNGMDIADAIAALPILATNIGDMPIINYTSGAALLEENLVMTAVSEVAPEPGAFVMNAGLNDAWYNPFTDGQGFFITVFPDIGLVNLAWFTYDTELPADDATANLGSPGHRWLTAIGSYDGDQAVLDINIASGGLFDTATEIQDTADGTITLTFADCGNGLVEYDIPSIDRQGSVPIQRVTNDNAALCEALIEE